MNNQTGTKYLSQCLSLIIDNRGKTPKKLNTDWVESGYRVISANNVKFSGLEKEDSIRYVDEATYKKWMSDEIKKGDILLTSEAPAGQIMYWDSDEKIVVGQRLFCLRPNEFVDGKYLKYFLQSPTGQFEINKNTTGSTVMGISAKMFDQIAIKITDKTSQEEIGSLLYAIDSKILLNERANNELESISKFIFDYWFVQYDFPNSKGKPYKSSGGKMVWDNKIKKEIPVGWSVFKIGDILKTSLGGTPSTGVKEYWEGGNVNWLNSGEIANFPIIDSELKITQTAINKSATELLPKGTVLLSITRHLRPTVLAIEACANQSVAGIREKGSIRYFYLYPYLKNEIPRLNTLRTGAQQPHINKDTVDESLIILPPVDSGILEKYNEFVGAYYELIINNAVQNKSLAELRDWLLPMLMNGQVKVSS